MDFWVKCCEFFVDIGNHSLEVPEHCGSEKTVNTILNSNKIRIKQVIFAWLGKPQIKFLNWPCHEEGGGVEEVEAVPLRSFYP